MYLTRKQEIVEKIYPLKKPMIFLDIGSGIGLVPMQVALTTGCEARGIELMDTRHTSSLQVNEIVKELHERRTLHSHNHSTDGMQEERDVGEVKLELGRFEDPRFQHFLSEVDLSFCNNYNEVFSERHRIKGQELCLDDFLIGLLCLMKPGAAVVTLEKLKILDEKQARERRTNQGLTTGLGDLASFFDFESFHYEETSKNRRMFSFRKCMQEFYVYKYTRNQEKATFLCASPDCCNAKNNVPIQAWRELDDGKIVLNKCELCGSNVGERPRRDRRPAKRFEPSM